MLRRSSLIECVSVLHGMCLQSVEFFFIRQYVQPCLSKIPKYTYYNIKSSLTLAYYASKGYQYYGEPGQDTNTKLFWKSVVWKFYIRDSSLVVFRVVSRGIKKNHVTVHRHWKANVVIFLCCKFDFSHLMDYTLNSSIYKW